MDGRTASPANPVWRALEAETRGRGPLDVLDAGGGTGGFAVPLAALGHRVTVLDPSPDSLAALTRRAGDAGVIERVRGVQGEIGDLPALLGAERFDLVCCHQVLEVVDSPEAALGFVAAALRPGGVASLLVAMRAGAALHRAVAGRLAEAAAILGDPSGRAGPADRLARRFDVAGLCALAERAGLVPGPTLAVRAVVDLVPAGVADEDADALAAIEERASTLPAFRDVAGLLHLLARPAAPLGAAPGGGRGPQRARVP